MCGIVGIISTKNVTPMIIDGLKRLEYRGYDSAGICVLDKSGNLESVKKPGRIVELENAVSEKNLDSNIGIGHTRWATHGKPNEVNSHPHQSSDGEVSLVHNGIIENFRELREELKNEGFTFASETDTEVIPNLISYYIKKENCDYKDAVLKTIKRLDGAFALAIMFKGQDDLLIVARKGSPILIGYGEGEMYIASGFSAISQFTNKITHLEEGDMAVITRENVDVYDNEGYNVKRDVQIFDKEDDIISKGDFPHFMLKEIYDQPKVVTKIINEYVDSTSKKVIFPNFPFDLSKIEKINIVACGTSFFAGLVAKYFIESMAKVNVNVDIASEFRYRTTPMKEGELAIFISQSGETADTLAALKHAKNNGQKIISVVNVTQSSMATLSDVIIASLAGIEIGVASTKAFISQLTVLGLLAVKIATEKGLMNDEEREKLIDSMMNIPQKISEVLKDENVISISKTAEILSESAYTFYTGRGVSYPIACEGALKLKEITYIPSEAQAAGELKHGPIALIDSRTPVIAIAPSDNLFEKIASNIEEVLARGGQVILISDAKGVDKLGKIVMGTVQTPDINNQIESAILCAVPVQMLAYYTALHRGTDVDKPRNLAKSVTVE